VVCWLATTEDNRCNEVDNEAWDVLKLRCAFNDETLVFTVKAMTDLMLSRLKIRLPGITVRGLDLF
jgi:hypothetical protein